MADDFPDHEGDVGEGTPKRGLDRPVQDALGEQLRTALNETAEKPAYLGDPAIPVEFEHQLLRLESTIEVREKGVEAVRDALLDLDPDLDLDGDQDGSSRE